MATIIDAWIRLIARPGGELVAAAIGHNRINHAGDALEQYVQDLFSNGFDKDERQKMLAKSAVFSYLGNNSNPPDMMLKNGDAIEVKKITNKRAALALNSSHPKADLFANHSMLTQACKHAESWTKKRHAVHCGRSAAKSFD